MEIVGLHSIDIVIIGIYMLGSVLLGLFCTKYIGGAEDFFVSGKALPFWAIGFSIVVSDIGAVDFVAVAGAAYTNGVSAANFDWMGSMPAMVFAAFVFVPYFWRSGVFTIPEFLGRRYNSAVQFVNALIWDVVLFVMLAVMLWVTADKLMFTVLGWNKYFALWLMAIVTGIYTFSGGLTAVVFTDVVQLVVMYVGGLGLLAVSLWEVGGWTSLREKILAMGPAYQNHFTILLPHNTPGPFPWTGIVFGLGIVLAIAYMSGNQVIVQRTLGARSEWDAKGGMLVGGFLKSFIPLMVALPGLCAIMLVPGLAAHPAAVPETNIVNQIDDDHDGVVDDGPESPWGMGENPDETVAGAAAKPWQDGADNDGDGIADDNGANNADRAVPEMIRLLLPAGLRGLMFAALFAALMSSISGTLNSATTIFVTDLHGQVRKWRGKTPLDGNQALVLGRVFTVVFILLSSIFAKPIADSDSIYVFLQTVLSLFQGPTLAILLLGIVWKRATGMGGLAGLVLGVIFCFVLKYTPDLFPSSEPFLFVAWWSFVFSILVTVIVSLLTPPEPEEKLRGLVWSSVVKDEAAQAALQERIGS